MYFKNKISIICAVVFLTVLISTGVFASAETKASAVFRASEPNAEGLFTVTMSLQNAKFNTFQFVLRYDNTTIIPVDSKGSLTSSFSAFASAAEDTDKLIFIGTKIDTEKGLIDFTGYVPPGSSIVTNDLPKTKGYGNIGNSGIEIYSFKFKKTGSKNVVLELADKNSSKPYSQFLPEGGTIYDAGENIPVSVVFDFPVSLGKSHTATPTRSVAEETETMTKAVRLNNSIALQIGNYGTAVNGALAHIDPENKAVVPYIDENNRTMVPVRFISERLGADVKWDPNLKQVKIILNDKTIIMTIGSAQYLVNGKASSMDTAPLIKAGWNRTMVPIRFVAEALGKAVEWDAANRLVLITSADKPWLLERQAEKEARDDILLTISPTVRNFVQ